MSTNELEKAKTLIQQKRYHEARKILENLDLPKAKIWLSQLDKIASSNSDTIDLNNLINNKIDVNKYRFVRVTVIIFYVIGAIVALGGLFIAFTYFYESLDSYYYHTQLIEQAILVALTSIVTAISLVGMGQLLQIMVELVRNSRRQTYILSKIAENINLT